MKRAWRTAEAMLQEGSAQPSTCRAAGPCCGAATAATGPRWNASRRRRGSTACTQPAPKSAAAKQGRAKSPARTRGQSGGTGPRWITWTAQRRARCAAGALQGKGPHWQAGASSAGTGLEAVPPPETWTNATALRCDAIRPGPGHASRWATCTQARGGRRKRSPATTWRSARTRNPARRA